MYKAKIFSQLLEISLFRCKIFLRELVSNAVDASQKLMTLATAGEVKHEVKDLKDYSRCKEKNYNHKR